MGNWIRIVTMCVACPVVVFVAAPAWAAEPGQDNSADPPAVQSEPSIDPLQAIGAAGKAIGAGLVILAAGFGIGRIGGQAVEGMSRQPEASGNIQTGMIISAALIEGATFFALIVCIIV